MKKVGITIRILQIVLAFFVLLLIAVLSTSFYSPFLVIGYSLLGRSPFCPAIQAFRGAQVSLRFHRTEEAYLADKHLFQLSERDAGGFHRWRTPEGDYWISGSSDKVLPVLVAQQHSDIYGHDNYGVRRGDIVLDCGAHIGVFTRKALAMGASKVIAIEPGPENLECLRRNLRDEISRGLVTVYPKGVWDQETTLEFHTFAGNSAADSFVTEDSSSVSQTIRVPVTTIDKLSKELGLTHVDFVKMDIKGSTQRALEGARNTLTTSRPRMAISTEESNDSPERIIDLCRRLQPAYLTECGYCAIENGQVVPMVVLFH